MKFTSIWSPPQYGAPGSFQAASYRCIHSNPFVTKSELDFAELAAVLNATQSAARMIAVTFITSSGLTIEHGDSLRPP